MPAPALVLFTGTFVNDLGSFLLPFFTLYLVRRGYSVPQAGVAITAYGLGELVANIFGGLITDRIGRRNTIALSMFSAGAFTLALWRATPLGYIYPLMFGFACASELSRPASLALIADLVPSRSRVVAFSLLRLATNVGLAVGLALGGLLAERSFDLLFVGDAATSIVFGFVSLAALPHGVRSTRREEVDLPPARRAILADRGFLLFLLSMLLMRLVYAQIFSTLPLFIQDQGYGPLTYGALLSLDGVIVVFAELPVIAWVLRHDRLQTVAVGNLLIGLGFASLLFAETIPLLVGMIAVFTVGEICSLSAASALAADRAPAHAQGRYQSALGSTRGLGFLAGPVLGTVVYSASPQALWWTCGAMGVAAALLALGSRRFAVPGR